MPRDLLPPFKAGEDVVARDLDEMRRMVERRDRVAMGRGHHTAAFSASSAEPPTRIVYVRMGEVLGVQSSSGFTGRTGTITFFDPNTRTAVESHEVEVVTSLFWDLPIDEDDLVPCLWQNGHLLPLSVRTVRHAQTCATAEGDYPVEGTCPNVYPIKFVRLTYADEAGKQEPLVELLDEDSDEPDDYVLNLFEGENSYLPEDSIIWIYSVTQQWFTFAQGGEAVCDSSSQSSSSGSSSEGSSASSSSESSASSSSTSSASDSSSLSSSSDSSSQGSSASSDSEVESEGCDTQLPSDATLIDGYDPSAELVLGLSGGCWVFRRVRTCDA